MSYAALKSNKNRNAVYYSKSCRCSVKRSLTTGEHKTQISTSYIENIMCQPRTLSSFLSLWLNHGRVWVCHCGSSLPLRTAATNLREVFILVAAYCISHRFHCRDSRPDQHFVRPADTSPLSSGGALVTSSEVYSCTYRRAEVISWRTAGGIYMQRIDPGSLLVIFNYQQGQVGVTWEAAGAPAKTAVHC